MRLNACPGTLVAADLVSSKFTRVLAAGARAGNRPRDSWRRVARPSANTQGAVVVPQGKIIAGDWRGRQHHQADATIAGNPNWAVKGDWFARFARRRHKQKHP